MQHSIEKIFLLALLGIFLFSFPVNLNASETADNRLVPGQASGEHNKAQASSKPNIPKVAGSVTFKSRSEIYKIFGGTLMIIIGLVAVALALYRWQANDRSLISFGVFCFLYGARGPAFHFLVNAPPIFWDYSDWLLTYLTPLPAWIFFEQLIGKGWKTSIRRIWQIQIVFVIGAAAADLLLRSPGAAMVANNVMAIVGIVVVGSNLFRTDLQMTRELRVLRGGMVIFGITALYENIVPLLIPGYHITNIEPFGLLVFIGCLVYAVSYRFFRNEKELITIAHELETARQIQSFILPRKTVDIQGLSLAAHYVPMASVAGDFYDFAKADESQLGILVADVSGHGVPASLISSMVKIAFSSQLPQASNPARVLAGMNQILCGKLESDFVTAGYLFIDTQNQIATYAGAGHPPLLLWRKSEQKIHEYREKGIILGQLEDVRYQHIDLRLKSGDRFFMYTDGIIETANTGGELYGLSRFKDFITSHANLAVGDFADAFMQHIFTWSGKRNDQAIDDDLTLVIAEFSSS